MEKKILHEKEKEIYEKYQNIICSYIVELEVRDSEYPIEIFNEIRSIFTHLSRYKLQDNESDLISAEGHIKRAILDCYKYLCISIAESTYTFREQYKHVDLTLAENGKFLSNEAILFASNHSKRTHILTIISCVITVISIVVAIAMAFV